MFAYIGRNVEYVLAQAGKVSEMIRSSFFWLVKSKLEVHQSFLQCVRIGVASLGVTVLTSLFTGMVLALQSGTTAQSLFNEPVYVGVIVGFSLVRELGPVLTAFVVTGRAGAAITAEIGTMKVTEQVDALYTLGTDPIKYLVIPRYIACMITIPLLTVFANFFGIFGGYLVSVKGLGVSSYTYISDVRTFLNVEDFMHGFMKSFLFAFVIATVCCYNGLNTKGGAEGVGKATTASVVTSMVLILVVDYFASSILVSLGF